MFSSLVERLKSVSGVQAVGVVNALPLSDSEGLSTLWVEGYPNQKQQLVEARGITQGYLSAMQTPLLQGRDFSDEDASGHQLVAIVNEAFATKYFATEIRSVAAFAPVLTRATHGLPSWALPKMFAL